MWSKHCEVCGAAFTTADKRIKTCGNPRCLYTIRQRNNAMNNPAKREKVRQSKLGLKNPNFNPDKSKDCAICGKTFVPQDSRVQTCGQKCMRLLQSRHNGMKKPAVAQRATRTRAARHARGEFRYFAETERGKRIISKSARKRMLTDNPMHDPDIVAKGLPKRSATMRAQYASGERSPHTYVWQDYKKLDGSLVRLQSSYEVVYARWLDKQDISWFCHGEKQCPTLSYIQEGIERTYHPDFYLPEIDEFIDTKSTYTLSFEGESEKMDAILQCNNDVVLRILTENDLLDLGIQSLELNYVKHS